MLTENYLAVRFVSLKAGKAWQPPNDGFFFLFVMEGAGDYSDGKLTRQVRQGDVLVLSQMQQRTAFVAKLSGMSFKWFSIQMEQIYPFFDIGELSLLDQVVEGFGIPFRVSANEARECHNVLAEMLTGSRLEQRVQVLAIAARILSKEFGKARTGRPGFLRAEEHMERVFQSLSETDFLSLSVPELAARFGCSRRHLTRLFHQFFGSSIAEFRMELRLMKVASLLRNPNVKIINIAEQCGFNQLGHFNSCFKRRFGVSPARWRKQLPKEREALVGDPAVGGMSMGSFMRRAPRSKALPLLLPVPDSHGLRPSDLKMPPPDPALLVATSTPASESFELIESLGS